MGIYLNPGNSGFRRIRSGKYIDKSLLINIINERMDSPDSMICVSRPRRFGKSYSSNMISAYYDCTCDSHELFDDLEIARSDGYENHINNYNIISIDISGVISEAVKNMKPLSDIPKMLSESIRKELIAFRPDIVNKDNLTSCFIECVELTGRKFIFIIDEWDAIIREAKNDDLAQKLYLSLLREWFKNSNFTSRVVAAAYLTGILPIKKDGSESAISDFKEYSILDPGIFAPYTGFTEDEVRKLCADYNMDFETVKEWYDGYNAGGEKSIYNPYSVMEAMKTGKYRSYWRKTSAAEALKLYINIDSYGINTEIIKLTTGEKIKVDTSTFNNDLESFGSKDDVLTLMIHLGYLTYDDKSMEVWIPNEEVMSEYHSLVKRPSNNNLAQLISASEKLLNDTLSGNEDGVARAIEKVRETNYAPQYYNNEQALRYAIKFAYIICVDRFMKIEELPSG